MSEYKFKVYDPIAKETLGPFTLEDLMLGNYPIGLLGMGWLRKDLTWSIDEPITRVEVIDENGRSFVAMNKEVSLSLQDEGRTLKIFFKEKKDD